MYMLEKKKKERECYTYISVELSMIQSEVF